MSGEVAPSVRADRWLWAARLFRSRALAARACDGGKVTINGIAAKAHKLVRAGDQLEVTLSGGKRLLRVLAVTEKRGPAAVAAFLYEDLTPQRPAAAQRRPERSGARPTKRERRRMDRARGW